MAMSNSYFSSRGFLGVMAGLLAAAVSAGGFAFGMMPPESIAGGHSILLAHLATAFFLFSSVPLFMVGLGTGPLSVLLAAAAGTLGLWLKTDANTTLYFALINAIPSVVLSWLALWNKKVDDKTTYWYPEGYMLAVLSALPCVLLIVKAYLSRHVDGGLMAETAKLMKDAVVQTLAQAGGLEGAAEVPPETLDSVITYIARILPALAGVTWISIVLTAAVFAQASLRQQGWNLRPRLSMVPMVVPQSLLLGVAAAGCIGYLAPEPYAYLGVNICILLCIPYFFLGLATTHVFARTRSKGSTAFLILFYLILCVLPWFGILVTLLGTLDQGLSLQQKMLAPKD